MTDLHRLAKTYVEAKEARMFVSKPLKWYAAMPRWASRILLEIVSVRVERVQDISGEDAWQEGVACTSWSEEDWVDSDGYGTPLNGRWDKAHEDFAELWNTIHAKNPESRWDANPWVWVIEFKVVTA